MTATTPHAALCLTTGPTEAPPVAGLGPEWLTPIRERAAARFAEIGLPTTRDESWRYTSLKTLDGAALSAPGETASDVTEEEIRSSEIRMDVAARLVIVNGVYQPELSDRIELPDEVVVKPMSEALANRRELVEPVLTRFGVEDMEAFEALNLALMDEGVFVHVPKGVRVEHPIVVRHLATPVSPAPNAKHPRSVVILEEGASATVVEHFAARSESDEYLTNAFTDLVIADNASASHYFIEREGKRSVSVCERRARLGANATFDSHSCLLGGSIVRNNVRPILEGERSVVTLNGVYLAADGQNLDNAMRVEHHEPNCESRQFFKGLLSGDGHGVFTGRIVVDRKAQKTDAVQSCDTLLLSETSRSTARPQLEIYADDVKCTHGATVGQLDEQAMFYLRQRGLTAEQARAKLVQAFARESVDRMDLAPVRAWLTERVLRRVPGSELVVASMES